jgi:heme-degrading monooxygenase HmoA
MVVTVFRSRLKADADLAALEALGGRMYEIASAMPGFLSYKDFNAGDGESVTIVEFADEPSLLAWRNQPDHIEAQRQGRTRFFAEYHIQVCSPLRDYRFEAGR